jgi:sugar phosphate isomerase/epimerase
VGPGSLPSRESAEEAIELLLSGGYDAAEIDFGDGFWMGWDYAHRLGALAHQAGVALSIHAPLAAFLGHAEYGGRKHHMAIGMWTTARESRSPAARHRW